MSPSPTSALPAPAAPPAPDRRAAAGAGRAARRARTAPAHPHRLGQILVEDGALAPGDLVRALALAAREEATLADILLAHGMVDEGALAHGLARLWGTRAVDLGRETPDPRLVDAFGAETCLQAGLLPLCRAGGVTVVAAARPEAFLRARARLEAALGPVAMAVAPAGDIRRTLARLRRTPLKQRAETRLPAEASCRPRPGARRRAALAAAGAAGLVLAALAAPLAVLAVLTVWALVTLLAATALKAAAAGLAWRGRPGRAPAPAPGAPRMLRLPVVSLLVPLHREPDIAPRLIARLGRLSYPRELLDVLLVVEEDDRATLAALARARLPPWMRVVEVPAGPLRTKPRALNYALPWCHGGIVGIYDAEDRPEPDQIHRIVRRFAERGPEVACLQGVLDFYNPRSNWLSRCFTIEYAVWFRLMLPGLARMGLPVPLGGTTVFLRRTALEAVGGWDAHNVTEDADLGIRLARHGYRTELVETVTEEEANCRALPWVRQRSRWLKGYAMTWAVHMRSPRRLWRELGPRGFAGFQVLFLAGLSQYALAPVLWSFWVLALGLPHPLAEVVPAWALAAMIAAMLLCEAVNIAAGLIALRARHLRALRPWVPTLHLYFPLGTLAVCKGLWEVVARPFFWDKTAHGLHDTEAPAPG